jgi:hypothetical protein
MAMDVSVVVVLIVILMVLMDASVVEVIMAVVVGKDLCNLAVETPAHEVEVTALLVMKQSCLLVTFVDNRISC